MENLKKYGDMFWKLANEVGIDIKNKSDEELDKLEHEARSTNDTNCSWTEHRIARTVLECVLDEKKCRESRKTVNK